MSTSGRVTDPESAPDEDCSFICKSSGVTVSRRHLHHLLVQQHLPRNHLGTLLGRVPAEGAFVVTAKSVDLKNQGRFVWRRKSHKRKAGEQRGRLRGHFRRDTQCACLQLRPARSSLAARRETAFSSEGRPRRDPAARRPPDQEREPGRPPCRNSCG